MSVNINWNISKNKGDLAVVYARFSSHAQGEQSIEGQLSEAHKYAAMHGYTVIREYVDRAKSGKSDNREEFQQMLKDTAKKQFNVIILWKVDRFGRNREEIAINKMRCRKNGVRVEYVAETIPDTPEGVILESVLEGFAEYYSLQLAQNVKRGMERSAEKCQVIGGGRILGYKTGPDKKYAIDEKTAPTVRMIYKMYADGATITEIIKALNDQGLRTQKGEPFTRSSLHKLLKNEKYIGIYNNNGKHIVGGVPRIIDDELFRRVQEMLKINKRAPAKTWARSDYLLADKIFCGKCGAPMYGESGTGKSGSRYNYYTCAKHKRSKTCDKKPVRQEDIEQIVLDAISDILNNLEILDFIVENTWQYYQAHDSAQDELHTLTHQLEQTEQAIKNLIRAIEAGIFSEETKARMDELTTEKTELRAAIADRELARSFHLQKEHIAFFLYELRDANISDREVQKRLIQTFVNSVFVFDDKVKLNFNFSGNGSTVTLKMLQAAESGEVFGRCPLWSTITHRYEHITWFANVFCLTLRIPQKD